MKQKKVLEIWQMIIIMVLLIAMLATMFVPAFGLNGRAIGKMYNYINSLMNEKDKKSDASDLMDLFFDDEFDKDDEEKIDENLADFEKEYDVKIRAISPLRIMTHDFASLFVGKSNADKNEFIDEMGDSYKNIKSGYNIIRTVLFLAYGLSLIALILIIVSFAAKLSKLIPLIYTIVYSVITACIFGYLRFGLMGVLVKKMMKAATKDYFSLFNWDSDLGDMAAKMVTKMYSYFYSYAFLFAFIVAFVILIVSIISLLVGGKSVGANYTEYNAFGSNESFDTYGMDPFASNPFGATSGAMVGNNPFGSQGNDGFPASSAPAEIPVTMADPSVLTSPSKPPVSVAPVAPVVQPMGKVQCTKGVAKGQGFQLPENRKVIVGKSMQKANLVVQDPRVSNVHCSIRYNSADNTYKVIDHSTNGTFVNGVRLQKDVPMTFPAGTVLCLADAGNEITLG